MPMMLSCPGNCGWRRVESSQQWPTQLFFLAQFHKLLLVTSTVTACVGFSILGVRPYGKPQSRYWLLRQILLRGPHEEDIKDFITVVVPSVRE